MTKNSFICEKNQTQLFDHLGTYYRLFYKPRYHPIRLDIFSENVDIRIQQSNGLLLEAFRGVSTPVAYVMTQLGGTQQRRSCLMTLMRLTMPREMSSLAKSCKKYFYFFSSSVI